ERSPVAGAAERRRLRQLVDETTDEAQVLADPDGDRTARVDALDALAQLDLEPTQRRPRRLREQVHHRARRALAITDRARLRTEERPQEIDVGAIADREAEEARRRVEGRERRSQRGGVETASRGERVAEIEHGSARSARDERR